MKRLILFFATCIVLSKTVGQVPDGTIAPDFTFTDLNGNVQNLYTYLNQGKFVALDVATTWCHPCWEYHTTGIMDTLYTRHDTPGDRTWKVFFIEGDGTTTDDQLNGIGSTEGNWVAGSMFPIINPSGGVLLNDFLAGYNINFYPTLYLICPNKKMYQDTLNVLQKPSPATWEYVAADKCMPSGLDNAEDKHPLTVYPNPACDRVILYFSLNTTCNITLLATEATGRLIDEKHFRLLQPGDHSLKVDVSSYGKGVFFFTLSDGNGHYAHKKIIIH